jgi:hypothetical protein
MIADDDPVIDYIEKKLERRNDAGAVNPEKTEG